MQTGAVALKTVWMFLKTVKIDIPSDLAIALLGIYPRDTGVLVHRGTCTPMFIAALPTKPNYGKSLNVHQLMNG